MLAGTGDHRSTVDGWLPVDVGAGGPESIDATYRFVSTEGRLDACPLLRVAGGAGPVGGLLVGAGRTEKRRLVERAPDELEVDGEAGA